jgi:hypothetical protein
MIELKQPKTKIRATIPTLKKTLATGTNAIPTTGHQWNPIKEINATRTETKEPRTFEGNNKQADLFLQEIKAHAET